MHFYEKVIKVKADVAAFLGCTVLLSEVVARVVKGVRRTFILTLDNPRHHATLEIGTKRNPFWFSFVPYWNKHLFVVSFLTTAKTGGSIHAAGLLSAL